MRSFFTIFIFIIYFSLSSAFASNELDKEGAATLRVKDIQFPAVLAVDELKGTLKKIAITRKVVIGHREAAFPLSYIDIINNTPVGYSVDICNFIVEDIKKSLKMPNLQVEHVAVKSHNRFSMLVDGTIDVECGSTTNAVERQSMVAFGINTFVSSRRMAMKTRSPMLTLEELNGKTVVTNRGTNSDFYVKRAAASNNISIQIIYGKDNSESLSMVARGHADAVVADDVVLAYSIASMYGYSSELSIAGPHFSSEPHAIVLRKDDPQFKSLIDSSLTGLMASGGLNALYEKWFMRPIPPSNVNLSLPMSEPLKAAIKNPTDKGI